jgi:hypothetical protein
MYSSDTGLFQSPYVMCGLTNGAQSSPGHSCPAERKMSVIAMFCPTERYNVPT